MKSTGKILLLFAMIGLMAACKNKAGGDAAKTGEAQDVEETSASAMMFNVNTQSTSVIWTGSKATGTHQGVIKVTGGELAVNNGNIEGGSFTIDMSSLAVTDSDMDADTKGKLEGHLKSGDFFEVEKFPTGKFVITSVEPVSGSETTTHNVTGNLTLKEKTHSVTFPANVSITDDKVSAVTPKFTINRTNWGINYNSGIIGTVKDKLINDDVALVINLNAAK